MRVLVIAPHMDDETLGMGGTIAKHVAQRDTVVVCICANRAYDHQYSETAIAQEESAAREAKKVLGYQDVRFLNLPDEQLDGRLIDVIVPLEKVCDEVAPDIVYTCHRGDTNQDHQAVFKATMIVCRSLARSRPDRLLCYEVPSSSDQAPPFLESQFAPNYYVDIGPHLDKKIKALSCYQRELRAFPHPRSPEGIATYARKRGVEVGCEAAEAFMVVREIWS